jgi:hypothetical protein
MVAQMVFPCFLATNCNILTIFIAVKLSRPEVGSSSRISYGSVTNSTPIDVRFLSPPEIVF